MFAVYYAILFIGITALSSQIVLIRELLVLFYGNEMSVGIILSSWLLWSSLGSLIFGRFSDKIKYPLRFLMGAQLLFVFLFFGTILIIRFLTPVIHNVQGQIISLQSIILYSFVILPPLCIFNGFLFSLGCQALRLSANSKAYAIGRVYLLEALGSAIGGLLTSFIFIRWLNPIAISLTLLFLACISVWLLNKKLDAYPKRSSISIMLYILVFLIFISTPLFSPTWNRLTRKLNWKHTQLLQTRDSYYGNISVTKTESQINVYENGLFLYSIPYVSAAEFALQPALLSSPDPRSILVIGGSLGETINQVFKQPSVNHLTFVEIDPTLIKMCLRYLTPEEKRYIDNGKVSLRFIDGARFIKQTKKKYDCIILNLPNPSTAQINRFFTKEFFQESSRVLTDSGILSFSIISSANYIGEELKNLLSCLYKTLSEVFPDIVIIPGDTLYFLACKKKGILTEDYTVLEKNREQRHIQLHYFRSYYLRDIMSPWRIESTLSRIKPGPQTPVNTNFHPVCYYLNLIFWSTYFGDVTINIFKSLLTINFNWFLILPGIALLCLLIFKIVPLNTNKPVILFPIFTSGFSEMTYQVVILISFQMLYGYVYYKLGIIFTSFMVGTALGSLIVTHVLKAIKDLFRHYFFIQIVFVLFSLILPGIIYVCYTFPGHMGNYLGESIIFPIVPLIAGFLNGYQFTLANRLYLMEIKSTGKTAGLTYGMDLLGACCGAFIVSAFFIPVFGIVKTCMLSFLMNLFSLILLGGYRKKDVAGLSPQA